jgi:hypothetical protein
MAGHGGDTTLQMHLTLVTMINFLLCLFYLNKIEKNVISLGSFPLPLSCILFPASSSDVYADCAC